MRLLERRPEGDLLSFGRVRENPPSAEDLFDRVRVTHSAKGAAAQSFIRLAVVVQVQIPPRVSVLVVLNANVVIETTAAHPHKWPAQLERQHGLERVPVRNGSNTCGGFED